MIDKRLLYFVGGFVAGCISGYLIAKGDKMFVKKKDTTIDENYIRRGVDNKVQGHQNASVRPVEAPVRRYAPVMAESIERARKASIEDPRPAIDDILAESETPIEPAGAEKIDEDIAWADKMTRRANENRGRRSRIISAETLGDLDATWDVRTLYYYAYDGTLATEDGELIDDIGLTVGDSLEKYGFAGDASQREIIVQNFDFSTVYEIEKVLGEYDCGLY